MTRVIKRLAAIAVAALFAFGVAACGSSNNSSTSGSSGGSSTPSSSGASTSGGTSSASSDMPGKGKPAITMGDKNFTEEYILGELYKQALEAKGYTVNLKANIGSSEIIDKALTSGKIDMYPEYTGVIVTELAHITDRPKSSQQTYALAKGWEEKRGFAVLDMTPFQDRDCIAVNKPYAQKNNLSTVGDLANVSHWTYGGPPENKTRYQGVVGLEKAYGLHNFTFKPLSIGLQYTALDSNKIDGAACFTTDGQLAGGKYTVLDDTKGIFGFQNVVPVIDKKVLAKEGPEFAKILNTVSSKLTTNAIIQMNAAVQIDKQKPGVVAQKFLSANGLV